MNSPSDDPSSTLPGDASLDRLVEDISQRLQAGEKLDLEDLIQSVPEHADRLRALWPSVIALASLAKSNSPDDLSITMFGIAQDFQNCQLGDFRILREIGRGGMGVVYEAEQISLGRQIALKMLPFTGMLNERQLQRFKHEARAVAGLQHPNIVPVYSVGTDRGVHFYAMQLIKGCTVAEIISQHSSLTDDNDRNHFRTAAQLGIQAALALQYAHELGIVHRDIKPSNLIVDDTGHLWVADFGLAQVENETNLTISGELLGTLRYMSPEQIDSAQGVLDHRCDVYSLGATLYELVTLHPAFNESSRPKLLKQILNDDPLPPRKFNPSIPHELETIILKALARNPVDRYASASALAEDLQRFLDGRTILAKSPGWVELATKWSRRHVTLVVAAFVSLLLISVITSFAAVLVWRGNHATNVALTDSKRRTREATFQSSRLALERGSSLCEEGQVGRGMNWFAYALRLCPDDESEYQHVIRSNLESWSHQVHPLELCLDHPDSVFAVSYNFDGTRLITSCDDGRIRIWDAMNGELLRTWSTSEPSARPLTLAAHPHENLMAVGDWNGQLLVVNFDTGQLLSPPRQNSKATGNRKRVTHIAFNPDGKLMLVASANGHVRFWPMDVDHSRGKPMLHYSPVTALAFAPDGKTAITGSMDQVIRAWAVPSGEPLPDLTKLPNDIPQAFAWQLDDTRLVIAGSNFGASIWDLRTQALGIRRFPHLAHVNTVAANNAHDLVATGSDDHTAQLWLGPAAIRYGGQLEHPAEVKMAALNPNSDRLATAAGNSVRIFRISEAVLPVLTLDKLSMNDKSQPLQFSADQQQMYAKAEDQRVSSWSLQTGQATELSEGPADFFVVSPDGTRLVWRSKSESCGVRLEPATQVWRHPLENANFVFSPSGKLLLRTSGGNAAIVDFDSGETRRDLGPVQSSHVSAAFSVNDRFVATVSEDRLIRLWDTATGQALGSPMVVTDAIDGLLFADHDTLLLVATANGMIWFFDIATQQQRRPRSILPAAYRQMTFHPNGTSVLGISGNTKAQFFDISTALPIGPPLSQNGGVNGLGFSPDGSLLVTHGAVKEVRRWRVPGVLSGSPKEIQRQVEASTGLAIGEGATIIHLNAVQWQERQP